MQNCCTRSVLILIIISSVYFPAAAQDSLHLSVPQKIPNSLGIKYDLITFDNVVTKPWHLVSVEYTKHIKKTPLITRLNYANRFSKSGFQLEAEAYPALSKKIYTYINAGYSNDRLLFPKYRAGFSLFAALPLKFEVEGGFRLLYFTSSTWIYTASVGKYYKSFWFNASTFLTPENNSILQSYFLKTRYYFNDTDFAMLILGTGISPDDGKNNILLNTNATLKAKKAEFVFRNTFKKKNIFLFNIGFMSQENESNKYANQYNIGIGLQRYL